MRNLISLDIKTIKWHTYGNVMMNKKESIIRIKARYIDFWRQLPFIKNKQICSSCAIFAEESQHFKFHLCYV